MGGDAANLTVGPVRLREAARHGAAARCLHGRAGLAVAAAAAVDRMARTDPLSRSRHTDPLAIRAVRRLAAPSDPRSVGDLALRRRIGRARKGSAGTESPADAAGTLRAAGLRVVEAPPRAGWHHPVGRREVERFLRGLGPEALYGLRCVELCRGPAWSGDGAPCFGRLRVPGRIALFDLPRPPWRLRGLLAAADAAALRQAGATVAPDREAGVTVVAWPGDSLATFMLADVLLHEIGHHVLQHNKGKRRVRTARTRDHEAFAQRFAGIRRAGWSRPVATA